MSSTNANSIPPPENESVLAHVGRTLKNSMYQCFGCVKTSDEKAKIKYKEHQIETLKKTFGVAYINLVDGGADEEALKTCLKTTQDDIEKIKKEVATLVEEVNRVNEETKSKIVAKPAVGKTENKPEATKPEEIKIEEAKVEDKKEGTKPEQDEVKPAASTEPDKVTEKPQEETPVVKKDETPPAEKKEETPVEK
jgi:hypothetical protein